MDFGRWSPSHTILMIVVVVGFVGQIAVLFYRTAQLEKRMDKQNDDFQQQGERLENRIDKRIDDVRTEMIQIRAEISDVRNEMSILNQNDIEHLRSHE